MFVDFNILNQLGSPSINSNTFANRPAAGQTGRLFVSTDTFEIYRDNGTGWDLIGGPGSSTVTGSGATGQVTYWTGTNTVSGENALFWDAAQNHLGINTATPTVALDVHSAADVALQLNGTGATPSIFQQFLSAGVSQYQVGYNWDASADYRRFSIYDSVGAKETITIDQQSRYVGINYQYSSLSDQPAYTLDVSGSLRITDSVYLATNANNRVGIGTTSPQYPLDVVTSDTNATAIVTTRENATGPSYFVGRCIGGTYASPTDQVTFGAILDSYGYRGGAYRQHGYLQFIGINASSGGGINGSMRVRLTDTSSVLQDVLQINSNGSLNVGADFTQTTYKFKVTGHTFLTNLGGLTASIVNTETAASGSTGYGLAIESEATGNTSYALILRNLSQSVVYGGVSTVTGQVGYWSIGFSPTGTIGNRLTVSGAFSVGSGSYLTTAAPSNGAMIQGNVLIGTTTDTTGKLQISGDAYLTSSTNTQIGFNTTGALNSVGAYLYFNRSGTNKWVAGMGPYDGSDNYQIATNGGTVLALNITNATGEATFISSIKTGAPTTGTAATWKLGQRVAAAVVLDTTQYIQVEVGGTFYKLAIVT